MAEVNMKYWWFQKKIYRYSGRIRTFYRRKQFFTRRLPWFHGCPHENFVRPIFERCFQVRGFSFRITEGIGLTGIIFHFWPQKQILSGSCHRNFWLLFHIHVKNLPIFMFLGLIWCKILCWAQKVYFMGSEMLWKKNCSFEFNYPVHPSVGPFVCRSVRPSVCPSVDPFVRNVCTLFFAIC
jgi:hypothetical protein